MKKLLLLLILISTCSYGQSEFDKITIIDNVATASTTKIVSQQPGTGELNYIDALNLPVSTATISSLAAKQNVLGYTPENVANKDNGTLTSSSTTYPTSGVVKTITDLKAPLSSPTFTGNPTAPTPTAGDNDTTIPTTAFVTTAITPKITITTAASITTATTDAGGLGQNGRHVVINNGVNAINLTCNGGVTASYGKVGTGAITFVQGSGRTLVQLSGTDILNGIAGSTATLWSNGTADYLAITNY